MKSKSKLCSICQLAFLTTAFACAGVVVGQANTAPPITMHQVGALAGRQYSGEGLSVWATPDGAQLHCTFQRLKGGVTSEGLCLSSTADGSSGEWFRVRATATGRVDDFGGRQQGAKAMSFFLDDAIGFQPRFQEFSPGGTVRVIGATAQFCRPGLTEEYTVSVDGVRQDFIIEQRPAGHGKLRLDLEVTGAKAEQLGSGVQLTLDGCSRGLVYNRLSVSDARGRELTACFQVTAANGVAVMVDDADAVYPLRIDPTFSDADWTSMGGLPGTDGPVNAMAVDDAGNLYFGGNFVVVGGDIAANRIAKWDGTSWSALGTGMDYTVSALAAAGTNLYAGGSFTNAGGIAVNRIAKWDGVAWSALGTGMDHSVRALVVSAGNLYAGGTFTNAGGLTVNQIAKWDGTVWSALGDGMNDAVYALAVSGSDLFVGGIFSKAGGISASRVAKWDGSTWSALGTGGAGSVVASLAVSGTDLYAGGDLVSKWNGSTWSNLASGLSGWVYALAVSGSNVYAGGRFVMTDGLAATNIAKWDGATWQPVSTGLGKYYFTDQVSALAVFGTNLFAGGSFTNAGVEVVNRVTKLDGDVWLPLATGLNGEVAALAISGTNLYVGGNFTAVCGNAVNYIAKWNGSRWSGLGTGMNSSVHALAFMGDDLYAAGAFTNASGVAANRIAKWNGNNWSPLGSGLDGRAYALAVSETNLYAGGSFTVAGGVTAKCVARWDGNTWSQLGTGFPNPSGWPCTVYALAVSGSNVYGGCGLTVSGGPLLIPKGYVASWDGTGWSQLAEFPGSPTPPVAVLALAISGTNVYAGGSFANGVAKWTGTSWSTVVGPGLMPPVYVLATSGTNLYAGGSFTTVGGVSSKGIAKWNGISWSPLGSGVANHALALAASGTALYVGGAFTNAGGKVSLNIARATIDAARGRFTDLTYSPTGGFGFAFVDGTVGQPYRIQTLFSLASGSWVDFTNFTYTAPVTINDPVSSATNKFFRAVTP